MSTHKASADLSGHIKAGRGVLHNGQAITDATKLPTDAQMDALEAANKNARLVEIDAQITALQATRAAVVAGP